MNKSRFKKQHVIAILKEHDGGESTADVCWENGINSATFNNWKATFAGLDVSDTRKLRVLEDENVNLHRLLSEQMLNNAILKDVASRH